MERPAPAVGCRVRIVTGKLADATAVVRFRGPTHFQDGEWVGLELAAAVGRNDGAVDDVRYFACPAKHGVFLRPGPTASLGARSPFCDVLQCGGGGGTGQESCIPVGGWTRVGWFGLPLLAFTGWGSTAQVLCGNLERGWWLYPYHLHPGGGGCLATLPITRDPLIFVIFGRDGKFFQRD